MIFKVRNGQHGKIIENPRTARHLKKISQLLKKSILLYHPLTMAVDDDDNDIYWPSIQL